MKLGLGIGLGFNGRAVATTPVFDPTTLALSLYVRADFTASPWTGVASAGASSGRNLTEASFPPTPGTLVNGKAPASFDGVASRLQAGVNNNVVYSASALSGWSLFYARTADAADASEYKDGQLFADITNAETVVGFTADGLHLGFYSGGYVEHDIACTTSAWHLAQWKLESGSLKARIDGGVWASKPCGNLSFIAPGPMAIGKGFGASAYLDGDVLEAAAAAVALSDGDFDNVLSYARTTYGLALT